MADTIPSDLFIPEVAAEYARQAFVDNIDILGVIGSSPDSPIQLLNDPVFGSEGQYYEMPVFKRISSLVTRRDITSTSTITPLELTGGNEKAVKVHKKIGTVSYSLDAARVSRARPGAISQEIGMQAGEQLATAMRETIINTIRGALAAMTTTEHTTDVWDATARTNLTPQQINALLNNFGDNRDMARRGVLLGRSEARQDLINFYLGLGVQGVADVAVRGGDIPPLGMPFFMADSAALTTADAGNDKYHTLLIAPGGVRVWFTLPLTVYPEFQDTSAEQVLMRWRADADYAVGVCGMGYNSGAGGANPTDATLLSSANWSVVYSDDKEVKLAELVHNYSGN